MLYLLITSLIWAFSFPLIGHTLKGIDPTFLATMRMLISLLVFLPFLRINNISWTTGLKLFFIGALEYGVMYIAYLKAYSYLAAHEVALFTIFTPLYATLIYDVITRKFHPLFFFTAFLAVLGTAVIKHTDLERAGLLEGILLVQVANICFAFGQIYYRKIMKQNTHLSDVHVFGLLYAGAFAVPAMCAAVTVNWQALSISTNQIYVILYLGVVASGVGFFLWNKGARQVDTGALAIFNNLKIPLAMTVSLLFFGEQTDMKKLWIGGGIILIALGLNEWRVRSLKARKNNTPHGTT